jgi:hypothetical protein
MIWAFDPTSKATQNAQHFHALPSTSGVLYHRRRHSISRSGDFRCFFAGGIKVGDPSISRCCWLGEHCLNLAG